MFKKKPNNEINNKNLKKTAPEFIENQHRIYLEQLENAVKEEGVKNVALSGVYASGKSSILHEFNKNNQDKSVIISLPKFPSTISSSKEEDKEEIKVENILQKEILKQLIFSKPPHKLPDSRLLRTRKPYLREKIASAIIFPSLIIYVLDTTNFLDRFFNLGGINLENYKTLLFMIPTLLIGMLFFAFPIKFYSLKLSRFNLNGLELSSTSNEYFDEHLDEIIYYFNKTKTRYVIFEDLDRFNNIEIFEDLRNLNTLVNSSQKKGVIFIYAIRESLFIDNESGAIDDKFFDLIIPITYFFNYSLENFKKIFAGLGTDFSISNKLLRIINRHVKNYRQLVILRNNFYMHREIIENKSWFHNIKKHEEQLLAMMLIKTLYPIQFEKLLNRESALDEFSRTAENIRLQIIGAKVEYIRVEQTHEYENPAIELINSMPTDLSWKYLISEESLHDLNILKSRLLDDSFYKSLSFIREFKKDFPLFKDLIENECLIENYSLYCTVYESWLKDESAFFLYSQDDLESIIDSRIDDYDFEQIWEESNGFRSFPNHIYNFYILEYLIENRQDEEDWVFTQIFIEILQLNYTLNNLFDSENPYNQELTSFEIIEIIRKAFKKCKLGQLFMSDLSISQHRVLYNFLIQLAEKKGYGEEFSCTVAYFYSCYVLSTLEISTKRKFVTINLDNNALISYLNFISYHPQTVRVSIFNNIKDIDFIINGAEDEINTLISWENRKRHPDLHSTIYFAGLSLE